MTQLPRWMSFGRFFMVVPIVFLLPTGISILATGIGPSQLAIVASFIIWAAIWIWIWLRALGRNHTAEVVGLAAQVVILTIFSLIQPAPVGSLLVFAFIISGAIFPLRRVGLAFAALLALEAGLQFARHGSLSSSVNILINDVVVGFVAVAGRAMVLSFRDLAAAREEIARLAVTEERLRFSRDLHDLLGQSLAVVVLKSELVAKQLPPGVDEGLRQELRDVARVARKSLNDVREAVSGYRRPSLTAEIGNARSALRAAGIGLRLEDTLGRVPPEQDAVLAWCVREGVTNVIRHSAAKSCVIRLAREEGTARLEIEDDGSGAADLGSASGSGLIGLRERVELAGGKLEIGPGADRGLRLLATMPAGLPTASELAVG